MAAGVLVLTAVVVGSAILGRDRGFPGPGTESVVAHVLASIVVLGAALFADRRTGGRAFLASLLVPVVVGILFWTQWWG
ncbi:hypothetical protein G4H71_03595 [Rhodococcus triatomae]|nr:hypothetical protein G4H72_04450 [Rhodococcus triatomae]QNG25504.1 hypothetical protein G4H71_03595 [Rhodococcus triatomae]